MWPCRSLRGTKPSLCRRKSYTSRNCRSRNCIDAASCICAAENKRTKRNECTECVGGKGKKQGEMSAPTGEKRCQAVVTASHGEYRIVTEGIIAFPPTERRCGESKLLVLWVAAWK